MEPGTARESTPQGSDPWEWARDRGTPPVPASKLNQDWSWLDHEDRPAARPDVSGLEVIAILVAHNAAPWLPQTLEALNKLTVMPTWFLAVDNGSTDATAELLERSELFDRVYAGRRGDSLGAAVNRVLKGAPEGGWLWLLHDDAIVEPDALERLLAHVVTDPGVDVTGPKLLQPRRGDEPVRISELGVTISDTGRRDPRVFDGEIDQLQHVAEDVLGVGTCGMLVRHEVWSELGGLAPEVPVFRDGVEFGWRANFAGYRVVTTPQARIYHRRVGHAGMRRASVLIGSNPVATDRLLAMRTVAAHHRGRLASVRLMGSSLVRMLGYLVAKTPSRAVDEWRALGEFVGDAEIRTLRRRVPEPDEATAQRVRRLRPGRLAGWQLGLDAVGTAITDRWRELVGGAAPQASLDELTGDDFAGPDRPQRSAWVTPFSVVFALLVVLAIAATRTLITPGRLAAPHLLPSRDGLAEAYAAYLAPIPGAPGLSPPPWIGWVALGSTLTFGQTEWLITAVVVLGTPLAMLSAYLLLLRTCPRVWVRVVGAAAYALIPVLLGGLNRGELALWVVAIFAPLLALAGRGLMLRRTAGPESWRSAWLVGLLLSLLVAFVPLLWAYAAVAGAVAIAVRRSFARAWRILLALAIPLVLLGPWWPGLVHGWSRILLGPDAGLTSLEVAPAWQLLLGRTPGPGLPPLWVGAVFFGLIWAGALVAAAVRGPRTDLVTVAGCGMGALAVAVFVSHRLGTAMPYGTQVRPEVGSWLLVGFGCLVWAATLVVDVAGSATAVDVSGSTTGLNVAGSATRIAPRVRRVLTWTGAVLAVAGVLTGALWWVVAGGAGPIRRDRLTELPPYIRSLQTTDAAARTLAINLDGDRVTWSLVQGSQFRLGDADRGLAFGGAKTMQARTRSIVGRLVAGTGDDRLAEELSRLAVANIWVTGATEEQKSRINNTPGLGTASGDERATVWRVPGTVGRIVITGETPTPLAPGRYWSGEADLPAAPEVRQLIIAEGNDPRWRVRFNGNTLVAQSRGNQTVFEVPASEGHLSYELATPWRPWLSAAQLVGLIAVAVCAAPALRREQSRDPVAAARRAAGREGRL